MKADAAMLFATVTTVVDAASGGTVGFTTPNGIDGVLYSGTPDKGTIEVTLKNGELWDNSEVDWAVLDKRSIAPRSLRTGLLLAVDQFKRTGVAPTFVVGSDMRVGFKGVAEYATAEAANAGLNWDPVAVNPPAWEDYALVDLHAFADALRGDFQLLRGSAAAKGGVFLHRGKDTTNELWISVTDTYAFRVERMISGKEVIDEPVAVTPTVSAQLRQLKKVFPKGTPLKLLVMRGNDGTICRFGASVGDFTVTASVIDIDTSKPNPVLSLAGTIAELTADPAVTVTLTRKEWAHSLSALERVGSLALFNFNGAAGEIMGMNTSSDLKNGEGTVRVMGNPAVGSPAQVAVTLNRLKAALVAASSTPGAESLSAPTGDDDDDVDGELLAASVVVMQHPSGQPLGGVLVTRPSHDSQQTFLVKVELASTQSAPYGVVLDHLV